MTTTESGLELDEIVGDFLAESHENLEHLDREFVLLERGEADRSTLSSIFRTVHTIKGTSGFFGFDRLQAVTHVGENLLSRMRDGELAPTPEIVTALLAMVDAVREMLTVVEDSRGASDGTRGYEELVATLDRLASLPAAVSSADADPAPTGTEPTPAAVPRPRRPGKRSRGAEASATDAAPETACAPSTENAPAAPGTAAPDTAAPDTAAPDTAAPQTAVPDIAAPDTPVPDGHASDTTAPEPPGREPVRAADATLRVDVATLDRIVNLVSELVLARNEVLLIAADGVDARLTATSQRLDVIAAGLQDEVMRTRMQPIGQLFGRFPRIVRDLAVTCGRQVRLDTSGTETELDRSLIDAMRDPLTHLIRNAVDHGIEPPEERAAAGKAAEGRIGLHAYHQNGQVIVEISDDGAGIYPSVIKAKAVQKGLLTPEEAAACSDPEAYELIFRPGFSTAAAVTGVSGRGVGMDVVKTSIEGVGGTVEALSTPGSGTTFRVRLPLTLAIIPALVVRSGAALCAVPTADVVELVGVGDDAEAGAGDGIELVYDASVYRLRGELLPLVDLAEILTGSRGPADGPRDILVLRTGGQRVGLIVDQVLHTSEIVVKPLGSLLLGVPLFAGATILGDGSLALILDLAGVIANADLESVDVSDGAPTGPPEVEAQADVGNSALLCDVGGGRRMAVPLETACRLEEFPVAAVERADGRSAVQYRERILPLVRLADFGAPPEPSDSGAPAPSYVQVIVCPTADGDIGLAVDQVVDLVHEPITVLQPSAYPGLAGSALVGGAVTDVVDVPAVLAAMGTSPRAIPVGTA